jgi:HlyD family secretion protein
MKKGLLIVLLAALAAAGVCWWLLRPARPAPELVLYGNVDLRQVELAFNDSERIAAVLVQEGDRVRRGQILARLDPARLRPQVAEIEATAAAQRAAVDRLHHGSRPEEIAQARAEVALARADAVNTGQQWRRLADLAARTTGLAISRQDLDAARAAADMAAARLVVAERTRDLAVAGPRAEDVAQGEAQLRAAEARLEFLRRQLADAELAAPDDATVRSRLLEPGEMASPQRPVLALALTDPKWVRVYVSDPDLGRVHPGEAAAVATDSFPGRTFTGWIGFISSVAEFTPKSVQTEELRTSLVYEVRVFVKDPQDELRLGMPATVRLRPAAP